MDTHNHRRSHTGPFVVLLLVALLATSLEPTSAQGPVARLHPLLAHMASETPSRQIAVIVQKADPSVQIEPLVAQLGGRVTKDLRIIHAFVAELAARDVLRLAAIDGVRWVSLDAPLKKLDCGDCWTTGQLANTYIKAIRANQLWTAGLQGQGIGVAVVDSGVNYKMDLYTIMGVNRVVASVAFHNGTNASTFDAYSHGTHVAGVIGGNGRSSNGKYIGVAPMANIINVKVNDDNNMGSGTASSLVQGLQWVLQNKSRYNIRVVNLSLNSTVAESYHVSPIDAAAEILWFNGIVVVASAGNKGSGAIYPPANDPFVITVGATNDKGTPALSDDVITSFSAYGTANGMVKPDLVAPGTNIISLMGNSNSGLTSKYPDHVVQSNGEAYFRISGTSMSAPIVAGAVALLLQDEPNLTPDQVKYRLMATANQAWPGYIPGRTGAGYLDIQAAVNSRTTQSANTGVQASQLLWSGSQPVTWGSVNWNSVNWNSVNWNSVNWNSVNWNSVNWNSDYWGN